MAAKVARGLGKGLDSLIPSSAAVTNKADVKPGDKPEAPDTFVDINLVEPNREQPRKHFDEDALQELSESIRQYGLIQPILVQDRKTYYEIIAGERRWRASKMAGLKKVPVIIRNLSEQEIVEISLIENIQREDLNPIEEAQAYKRLLEEFHLKHAQIVEGVMRYFADELGYGDEVDFWGNVGLLHDLDFEQFPEEHCKKEIEIMRSRGIDERLIQSERRQHHAADHKQHQNARCCYFCTYNQNLTKHANCSPNKHNF